MNHLRVASLIMLAGCVGTAPATVVDFEDLTLGPESYYNGSDGAGGFSSQGAYFPNQYDDTFGSWSGFSYSNRTDTTTSGFTNQYSAFAGTGAGGGGNYGVAFDNDFGSEAAQIIFPDASMVSSIAITNTAYAGISMRDGDAFAKQFGGATGDDPDYFKLTISGINASGSTTGSVDFYLADYRFTDNSQDYIVDEWQSVELSSLGIVNAIEFQLETTDVGMFGANTPYYFAVDHLDYSAVPEPDTLILLLIGWVGVVLHRRRSASTAGIVGARR